MSEDDPKPDYPYIVWPFGRRGQHGYLVRFPDLPGVEGRAFTYDAALEAAQKAKADWFAAHLPNQIVFGQLFIWLTFQFPAMRPKWARLPRPGDFAGGICPCPPSVELTKEQQQYADLDVDAIVTARRFTGNRKRKRGRQPDFWRLNTEALAAEAAALNIKLPEREARTLQNWRNIPEYVAYVYSRLIDRLN